MPEYDDKSITDDEAQEIERIASQVFMQLQGLVAAWCAKHGFWEDNNAYERTIVTALYALTGKVVYIYTDHDLHDDVLKQVGEAAKEYIAQFPKAVRR
jgi:hypothetical protein